MSTLFSSFLYFALFDKKYIIWVLIILLQKCCHIELVIKNNKNIGKRVYLCQENITGIFAK